MMTRDDLKRIESQRLVEPSDVDDLIEEVRRLRKVCAKAAGSLVRECRAKNVDTMWHAGGCTLWEFLNLNGDELEEPVEFPEEL